MLTTSVSNSELTLHLPRGISDACSGMAGDATGTNLSKFNPERSREVVTTPAYLLTPAVVPPTSEVKAGREIVSNLERVMKSNRIGIEN